MQKIVKFMTKVKDYNFNLLMSDQESPDVEGFVFNIKKQAKMMSFVASCFVGCGWKREGS